MSLYKDILERYIKNGVSVQAIHCMTNNSDCNIPISPSFRRQSFFFFFVARCSAQTSTQYFFLNLRMKPGSLKPPMSKRVETKSDSQMALSKLTKAQRQYPSLYSISSTHCFCSPRKQLANQNYRKSPALP